MLQIELNNNCGQTSGYSLGKLYTTDNSLHWQGLQSAAEELQTLTD